MAQAVSRRPLTAETQVRPRVSPRRICGGQSGTGTGFTPRTSVFPYKFHFTGAPLHGKRKKLTIFITGLHNKPQGCGASVASTAGPFTNKKKALCASTRVLMPENNNSWSSSKALPFQVLVLSTRTASFISKIYEFCPRKVLKLSIRFIQKQPSFL
jgi:hypothetical protein